MKTFLRNSWWWAPPLLVVVLLAATYLSMHHRREIQDQIAEEIVRLGGRVNIRMGAPAWLLHFASDDYRNRFSESDSHSPWLPDQVRNSILGNAVGAAIMACDVADRVEIIVEETPQPPADKEEQDEEKSGGFFIPNQLHIYAKDLPQMLVVVSKIPTIRELRITCWADCELDFQQLPESIELLEIDDRVYGCHAKFRVKTRLHKLQSIICSGGPELWASGFDAPSLEYIGNCSALQKLSLGGTAVSDLEIAHLRNLRQLESVVFDGRQLSDSGLETLKGLPKLKEGSITVKQAGEQKVTELLKRFPALKLHRLPEPKPGDFPATLSIIRHGSVSIKSNGFDRPAIYGGGVGMF